MYAHAQSPCRIGIAGGGTDLPAWTSNGRTGLCVSLAIQTYTHAVAITRPDGRVVASYRRLDEAASATEIANGLIRESALMHGFEDGFEVHTLSEVSSQGTGLGVSSSIAAALAACFSRMATLRTHAIVEYTPQDIAQQAWAVEIDCLRRPIGRQDHMAAAHGGLRLYAFDGDGARVERTFTEEEAAWAAAHLILLPLSDGHDSRAILGGVKDPQQLQAAMESVAVAIRAIEERSPVLLGRALEMGQSSKLAIPGAVPPAVSAMVAKIHGAGVYGCKIAGAGGGGHLVVACEPGAAGAVGAATGIVARTVAADLHGVRSHGWL